MKLTSIITVNYNQPQLTCLFLRSILDHDPLETIEVIVVDNGSREDHGLMFKAVYPQLIYIRSEKNLGFAGGNNLGIGHARGEYLLFLNNDTEITQNFVRALRDELDHHAEIGLISPLILFFEDKHKIQYAGYTPMNYLTGRNKSIGALEDDHGQYDAMTTVTGYCHGAAMMCRKADLARVGLMAEHFFLYYEELDWCEKFKRAGFSMGFTGKAKIYHKESMSVGKASALKTYFMARNRWLFIRRNAPWPATLFFACYYLLIPMPYLIIKHLARGRFDLAKAVLRGMVWNTTHSTTSGDLGIELPAN
ncbi:glycosyltransferase family 2 protein [Parapedobacter koreensis]|nr:glycosyltransferase family 2 protein [Parapedobacter koreensis]